MPASIPNDIYQFSLHSAYHAGLRDGGPPVAFLTNHGTHGIGYFESDEDEPSERPDDMIQLDSTAYTISPSGAVAPAERDATLPFTDVTVFQPTARVKPPSGTDSKQIRELLSQAGKNTPRPFRVSGPFKYIGTQQQTYWGVQGTIFGFAFPAWQKGVSGDGLQACFLSSDKAKGGRVEDFEVGDGCVVEWAKCGRFHLGFPQDEEYEELRI